MRPLGPKTSDLSDARVPDRFPPRIPPVQLDCSSWIPTSTLKGDANDVIEVQVTKGSFAMGRTMS